jgi:hypothetical protein
MNDLQKLYSTLVREGKYTKSFDEFQNKWNDETYRSKVYQVVHRDGLYTKDFNTFNQKYTGQEQPQVKQPVTPPVTQQTNESEKNAFAQQIEITPTKIENFKKNKVDNHITEFVFFILFLFIVLYFFHKRK